MASREGFESTTTVGGTRTTPNRPGAVGRAPARPTTDRPERAPVDAPNGARDRGLVDLLKELRNEATTLVEKEIDLAKTELGEKMQQARNGVISLASGGMVLFAGLILTLMGAAAGLYALLRAWEMEAMIAGWLAPAAIGVLTLIIGAIMVAVGKKNVEPDALRPRRTERSLHETKEWAERKV